MLAAMAVTSDIVYDFGLGLDFTESIALAGILSLTSLGVAAKVLVDEGHLRAPIGIRIFTTALIAELIALLLVGFTIGEHTHQMSWGGVLVLLAQIVGFTVVTWVLASRVIPPVIMLLQRFLYVPQLSFGLLLGGLFLTVAGAAKMGLHGSLGALLFGAALSGMPTRCGATSSRLRTSPRSSSLFSRGRLHSSRSSRCRMTTVRCDVLLWQVRPGLRPLGAADTPSRCQRASKALRRVLCCRLLETESRAGRLSLSPSCRLIR